MRAVVLSNFGEPSVLRVAEVPTPKPKPGHLVVRVLAAGLNRLDHYLREGSVTQNIRFPHVLGSDASGVVHEVGEGVEGFHIGERVIPMPGYPLDPTEEAPELLATAKSYAIAGIAAWGAYAEFMEVPARWVVKDTTDLPPEQAATLPMVLVTCIQAVRKIGAVSAGQTVLVHAGASGTGSMSIQIAKALGAKVATTVRGVEKARAAEALGADLVIDITEKDFVAEAKRWTGGQGLDVVIDNLGGSFIGRSVDAVRTQGRVVALGFVDGLDVQFNIRSFFFGQKMLLGSLMGGIDDLTYGLELARTGLARPVLDEVFRFENAPSAHERLASGKAIGSVVLVP